MSTALYVTGILLTTASAISACLALHYFIKYKRHNK